MSKPHTLALALVLVTAFALAPAPRARVLLPTPPTITIVALTPATTAGIQHPISTNTNVDDPPIPTNTNVDDPVSVFRAALTRSPWPAGLHQTIEAIATCESSLDPHKIGDGGLAFGWLQIRADYHPALAARYELLDGPQNLEAGWAIYEAAGGSFWPWSCWAME